MRFVRFWALFGAWRTIDFEKTRRTRSALLVVPVYITASPSAF
jgi:hypothetical protein